MAGLQLIDVRIARELTVLGVEGARWVLLEVPPGVPAPATEREPAAARTGGPSAAMPPETANGPAAVQHASRPAFAERAAAAAAASRPGPGAMVRPSAAGAGAGTMGAAGAGAPAAVPHGHAVEPGSLSAPRSVDAVFTELVAERSGAMRTVPASTPPTPPTPLAGARPAPSPAPAGRAIDHSPSATPITSMTSATTATTASRTSVPPRPAAPAPAWTPPPAPTDDASAESIFEELPGDGSAFGRGGAPARRGAGRLGIAWGLATAAVVVGLLILSAWLAFAPARVADEVPGASPRASGGGR